MPETLPYFDYNDIFLETTTVKQYDKLMRLRRCLPENLKVHRNDIYGLTGINRLCDRSNNHLLKIMYKRTQNIVYLDDTEGRTRLHDAPVLKIPFPNNEIFRKNLLWLYPLECSTT